MAHFRSTSAFLAVAALLAGCASSDMDAVPKRYSQATANAAYTAGYNGAASYSAGAHGYSGAYWSPQTFGNYAGWPADYRYGEDVGENACRQSGTLYTCDTNGDGMADIYGDTADGSFASPTLRVTGRGKAFAWGSDCACWRRAPAYDGPRKPDELTISDERD